MSRGDNAAIRMLTPADSVLLTQIAELMIVAWAREPTTEEIRQRGAKCIRSETHIDNVTSIRYHEGMGFARGDVIVAPDGDRIIPFRLAL